MEVKDGSVVQANEYDGLNRRIIRDETGGSGELVHFYYNEQWQVMEERVGSATTADKQYVYHPYYVDAVAMMRDSSGDEYYYLQDSNFNVTALVDDTGSVVERYQYTPYGEVEVLYASFADDSDGLSDVDNEYLYTGRRLDPETGLQLNRNRFYHQQLGRWASRDPINYGGGPNLYGYVRGKPTYYEDPYGLQQFQLDYPDEIWRPFPPGDPTWNEDITGPYPLTPPNYPIYFPNPKKDGSFLDRLRELEDYPQDTIDQTLKCLPFNERGYFRFKPSDDGFWFGIDIPGPGSGLPAPWDLGPVGGEGDDIFREYSPF